MKKPPVILRYFSLFMCASALISARASTTNTLSASLAGASTSATNRGFLVRVAQAWSTNGPVANSYTRAYKQINATLLDTNNLVITNAALPGPNSDGSYSTDTINFEVAASCFDVSDESGVVFPTVCADYFPGIPGQEGSTENFAVEVTCFLQLPAGETVFGISSGADRTDAN